MLLLASFAGGHVNSGSDFIWTSILYIHIYEVEPPTCNIAWVSYSWKNKILYEWEVLVHMFGELKTAWLGCFMHIKTKPAGSSFILSVACIRVVSMFSSYSQQESKKQPKVMQALAYFISIIQRFWLPLPLSLNVISLMDQWGWLISTEISSDRTPV